MASCVRGDFVELQKLVKEINQEYSLDLEKRIIETEPKDYEILEFVLKYYSQLKFSPAVDVTVRNVAVILIQAKMQGLF